MEAKDLLPLLGVLFGWSLSELSKYFRERSDDKKLINRIIAELLFLRYEIYQFRSFAKGVIDVHGYGQDAEKERQRMIREHLISTGIISNGYEELFNRIASYDPILAKELMHKITSLRKIEKIKLNEVAKIPDVYESILSTTNELLDKSSDYIEKVILKLSFKTSLALWIRIKKELKKDIKNLDNWGKNVNKNMKLVEKMGYNIKK